MEFNQATIIKLGAGIVVGLIVGAVMGVAINDFSMGVVIGVIAGAAIGVFLAMKSGAGGSSNY